jgi:hypothetical protein
MTPARPATGRAARRGHDTDWTQGVYARLAEPYGMPPQRSGDRRRFFRWARR